MNLAALPQHAHPKLCTAKRERGFVRQVVEPVSTLFGVMPSAAAHSGLGDLGRLGDLGACLGSRCDRFASPSERKGGGNSIALRGALLDRDRPLFR